MTLNLTGEDISRLKNLVDTGITTNTEIKDLKDSLKELVADTAEELDVSKKLLNDAIRIAFKATQKGSVKTVLDESQDELDEVEALLQALGKK